MVHDSRRNSVKFVRYDPAFALAPIFRPIFRGRRPGGLSIEHKFKEYNLEFSIWRSLDARDQSVLLAIQGIAGMQALGELTHGLHADISTPLGAELWSGLKPTDNAHFDTAIVVSTLRSTLMQVAGIDDDSRKSYGRLEDRLVRLSRVGCRVQKNGYDWSMQLLAYLSAPDGYLNIALNPRFAAALSGQYVYISLAERRKLTSEPALLSHAWLSGWLRPGARNSIRLDRLAEKVWGAPSKNSATNRKRRSRIAKALGEVSLLPGWEILIEGEGATAKAELSRSKQEVKIPG